MHAPQPPRRQALRPDPLLLRTSAHSSGRTGECTGLPDGFRVTPHAVFGNVEAVKLFGRIRS